MRIHAIESGRLTANETFLRGDGWGSLLRRRRSVEFPAYFWVLEHPEGPIAIDTGMSGGVHVPRAQRRIVPVPRIEQAHEAGPRLRTLGIDPAGIRRVVLTHLDWDHAGGLAHFPAADVLLHRPEFEFASTLPGRMRYQPRRWPRGFSPRLYDLDAEPYGPFPRSRAITRAGDVRVVPLPGHSAGHVAVAVEDGDATLVFCGDHVLRQDWFLEDHAAGRLLGLGIWFREQAEESSLRLHELCAGRPTVLLPSHDSRAPQRLERRETFPLRRPEPAPVPARGERPVSARR